MRLVLALKIDPPEKPEELALAILSCLEKLPLQFSTVLAFSPDDGVEDAINQINSILVTKS